MAIPQPKNNHRKVSFIPRFTVDVVHVKSTLFAHTHTYTDFDLNVSFYILRPRIFASEFPALHDANGRFPWTTPKFRLRTEGIIWICQGVFTKPIPILQTHWLSNVRTKGMKAQPNHMEPSKIVAIIVWLVVDRNDGFIEYCTSGSREYSHRRTLTCILGALYRKTI